MNSWKMREIAEWFTKKHKEWIEDNKLVSWAGTRLGIELNANVAIETRNPSKRYPGGVLAVDGLSLRVWKGEVFGFLGPLHPWRGSLRKSQAES